MAYTWEQVMLNIDSQNELEAKQEQMEAVEAAADREQNAASLWSLGLSVIGGALFGPAGIAAGKVIGRQAADWFGPGSDWETMEIDEGKFYTKDAKEFNKSLKDAAKDQSQGQIIDAVTDLATMYIQAGGLQKGPTDFTTFGSGEDAWTVFGEDTKIPFTNFDMPGSQLPQGQSLAGMWNKDLKGLKGFGKNISTIGKKIGSVPMQQAAVETKIDEYAQQLGIDE